MNRLALCQDENQHGHVEIVIKLCKKSLKVPKVFLRKSQRRLKVKN